MSEKHPDIVIIGAGVMGQGLAEAVATAGHEVTLVDRKMKLAERGIKGISEAMDREISRWALAHDSRTEPDANACRLTSQTQMKNGLHS